MRLAQRMCSGLAAYAGLHDRAHERSGYGHEQLYRCDVSQTAYGLLVLGLRWSVWALADADEGGQVSCLVPDFELTNQTLTKIWETKNVTEPAQMALAASILRRIGCQAPARRGLALQWLEGIYGGSMPTPMGKTPPPPAGELPAFMSPTPPTPPPALEPQSPEAPLSRSLPPSPPHEYMPLHPPELPPPEFRDPFQDALLSRRRSFILDVPPLGPRRHSDTLIPRRHSVYPGHASAPSAYFPPPLYPAPTRPMAPMSTGFSVRSGHFPTPPLPPPMPAGLMRAPPSPSLYAFSPYSPAMGPLMSPNLAPNFTGGSLRPSLLHYDLPLDRPQSLYRSTQRGRTRTTSQSGIRSRRDSNKTSSHRRSASAGGTLQGRSRRNSAPVGNKKPGAASGPGILARSWNMLKRK